MRSLVTAKILFATFALWIALDGSFTAFSKGDSGGSGQGCDSPELKPEVKKEIDEQKQKGHDCVSGVRSRAEQEALYAKAGPNNGGAVAPPGHSKHETGEAFDSSQVFECTTLKRLNNAAHAGNTHCSTTGG